MHMMAGLKFVSSLDKLTKIAAHRALPLKDVSKCYVHVQEATVIQTMLHHLSKSYGYFRLLHPSKKSENTDL